MNRRVKLDARYTFALEWCGAKVPLWVARFDGAWLGSARTNLGAKRIAGAHRRNLVRALKGKP